MQKKLSFFLLFLFLFSSLFFFVQNSHADGKIVINEFVPHPSSGNKEWVEIYNPDNVDLSNYWIDDDTSFTDDSGSSSKKKLSGIVPGKDPAHPYIELTSAMFNNSGDSVVLFDESGNIVDQYTYAKDPGTDVAIGRTPDGSGEFQVLASSTQGDTNSTAQPVNIPTSSPAPTATPTPMPTRIPTPTHTPAPAKTSTPTKSQTITSKNQTTESNSQNTVGADVVRLAPSIVMSDMPTAILGVSTSEAVITHSPAKKQQKEEVLINGSTTGPSGNPSGVVFLIGGAVLLIGCGILVFWKMKRKNHEL